MAAAFEGAGIKPWSKYIDYLRRAFYEGATELEPFFAAYDKLSRKDKEAKAPEEICDESNVPAKLIFGHVAAQLWELGYAQANMMLAVNHPKIVKRAVDEAQKAKGFRDRENLLKAGGVIPIPKNNSIHFSFHKHVKQADGERTPQTVDLPSFEQDMNEVEDAEDFPQLPPGA